jgi:hypothetical protein
MASVANTTGNVAIANTRINTARAAMGAGAPNWLKLQTWCNRHVWATTPIAPQLVPQHFTAGTRQQIAQALVTGTPLPAGVNRSLAQAIALICAIHSNGATVPNSIASIAMLAH